jgi:hypothetical protein
MMKTSSIASSLSFVALGGATLMSTLIVFGPLPRALLPAAPPQSAVLPVAPAAASGMSDAAARQTADPAADRDFDMP